MDLVNDPTNDNDEREHIEKMGTREAIRLALRGSGGHPLTKQQIAKVVYGQNADHWNARNTIESQLAALVDLGEVTVERRSKRVFYAWRTPDREPTTGKFVAGNTTQTATTDEDPVIDLDYWLADIDEDADNILDIIAGLPDEKAEVALRVLRTLASIKNTVKHLRTMRHFHEPKAPVLQ
jgi:hypothetical protein